MSEIFESLANSCAQEQQPSHHCSLWLPSCVPKTDGMARQSCLPETTVWNSRHTMLFCFSILTFRTTDCMIWYFGQCHRNDLKTLYSSYRWMQKLKIKHCIPELKELQVSWQAGSMPPCLPIALKMSIPGIRPHWIIRMIIVFPVALFSNQAKALSMLSERRN